MDKDDVNKSTLLTQEEKQRIINGEKVAGICELQEPRKELVTLDTFHVYGHSAVTSPVCDLEEGQLMNCDTINGAYAIAKTSENNALLFLGIQVPSQIGNRQVRYKEHLTVFILNGENIIKSKIEYNKQALYNSIINIPCMSFEVPAGEEIHVTVVFHKTGTYKMKSKCVSDTECTYHNRFSRNYYNAAKTYSKHFDFIDCLVFESVDNLYCDCKRKTKKCKLQYLKQ
jgi:hypothetical protein